MISTDNMNSTNQSLSMNLYSSFISEELYSKGFKFFQEKNTQMRFNIIKWL